MKKNNFPQFVSIQICIIILCISVYFNVQAQNTNPKLYMCLTDMGPKTLKFMTDSHIENLFLFDRRYIDPQNTGQVNVTALSNIIKKEFPNSTASGIGLLDWEGKTFDGLSEDPQSPNFKNSMNAFIGAIKLAKSLRPNVKWGFFGLPYITRYKDKASQATWIQSNNNVKPLLQQCDVFFPDPEPLGAQGFATMNMQGILPLAKSMNELVIPYVWNRYYTPNVFPLIPISDFKTFINTILTESYQNKKASGVVWWSADTYYYEHEKAKGLIDEMSRTKQPDFVSYHDSLMIDYVSQILTTVKNQ